VSTKYLYVDVNSAVSKIGMVNTTAIMFKYSTHLLQVLV